MFSETFANHTPPGPFIILSEVDSTNNYAMAKLHAGQMLAGSCFQAIEQSAGKGQRGRSWAVSRGENITMSLCLRPLHAGFPFLLSGSIALGCYDFIKELGINKVSVKWPNDLYIGDRKAGGVLIENLYSGAHWDWAVVGTGININQIDFGALAPNAISVKSVTGSTYDVQALGKRLRSLLLARVDWLRASPAAVVMEEYNSVLYKKSEEVRLRKDSATFSTTISHVTDTGYLVTRDTMERMFAVGEVVFV